MIEVWVGIAACIPCVCLFFAASVRLLGIAQQCGYKNAQILRWLKRKDNLFFNRLTLWGTMGFLTSAIVALCFSPLGVAAARVASALPFFLFSALFLIAERKYALKVPLKATGRVRRISVVYILLLACVSYLLIALLDFLSAVIGKELYGVFAFTPFALIAPILLPFVFIAANFLDGIFEELRNKKFVKRAGQVLNETEITRVAIVGSYGKTSVKNILATILSQKFQVVATPESYNTPMGIAKTVFSENFQGKQVFIAEMGARKTGDIAELCGLVKPDHAIFTGVCAQHIQSFGSEENVFKAKCEILAGVKENGAIVCGNGLAERIAASGAERAVEKGAEISSLALGAKQTEFVLTLGEEKIAVCTKLLGKHNAENIALAAKLAYEMGLTAKEIAAGVAALEYIPHRLQLLENGGRYILDDAYNANEKGAKEAIEALNRFEGKKWLVTPGIVEGGILEEALNARLGEQIAKAELDRVILVGETLVGAVKNGYLEAGGNAENLTVVKTLSLAQKELGGLAAGDCVLFLNDLPDAY
ncbi:MAG: UDP-N-acetylmuramoyl-tripeptide--D-alanyl-D-alanine ligase [Clostridia bacterium]|nr:UDP-N-acetylmuramoyl-tripeptide--D-alanyl-D-alanine ligase [Clostridia bacterium]